jgi:CheY-like chemotaxis protein
MIRCECLPTASGEEFVPTVSSSKTAKKSWVVLIVDDDADLRRLWRTALHLSGFQLAEAADGIEALQYLEQHTPDLVVLDLSLPRLSGLEVRQEILAHADTRNIPIVIVTGSTAPLTDLGVHCVLRKPFAPEELVIAAMSCSRMGAVAPIARHSGRPAN